MTATDMHACVCICVLAWFDKIANRQNVDPWQFIVMYVAGLGIVHIAFTIFGVIKEVKGAWLDAEAASVGEESDIFGVVGVVSDVREPAIAA